MCVPDQLSMGGKETDHSLMIWVFVRGSQRNSQEKISVDL